jgi:hypothetical protein
MTITEDSFQLALPHELQFIRGRIEPALHSKRLPFWPRSLSSYGKTSKKHLHKFCFCSLCVTVGMCLHKSVTKELLYWLLREHRIAVRRLVDSLTQKCLFLVPWQLSRTRLIAPSSRLFVLNSLTDIILPCSALCSTRHIWVPLSLISCG